MKRYILPIVVLTWVIIVAAPVVASSPTITGEISGVEICPQFVCDAAIFNGTCDCVVDNRQTIGFFWVSIKHDPLAPPLQSAEITGGKWNLTTLRGKFSGRVKDGSIINNGDNTFDVTATLHVRKGGKGDLIVSGVLDHTEFPPTFEGDLVQPDQSLR
jgi:hypothetical protein